MSTAGRFCHIVKLGEGTYGSVYRATEKETGRIIAFKRMTVTSDDEGMPGTAIREICLLKELRHDNIVSLYEVLYESPKITLVFELCDCDMKQYLEKQCPNNRLNSNTEVRPVLLQMFTGLHYLHSRSVVHRDLKPQNVFLNIRQASNLTLDGAWGATRAALEGDGTTPYSMRPKDTVLVAKLGDFGLARVENIPVKKYSHEVVTLWYRSPDVLMGSALYSFPVDVWSMGGIFYEMVTGQVLFAGRNEDDQMLRMMRLLGSPTKDTWPSMRTYPGTTDRLNRVSAFVAQQRQDERSRRSRRGNQPPAPNEPFSFTAYCLEHEDETTLMNNANSARGVANSLRLPSELWFPNPLFDDFVRKTGFYDRVGEDGVDLLRRCLRFEPSLRITAAQVLAHPFLQNVRAPTLPYLDQILTQLDLTLLAAGL